jgi:hypothetical protein
MSNEIINLNLTPEYVPRPPAGTMCVQHAATEAVARCRVCNKGMCATCDFELPGNMHVCPNCIESHNDQEISPKRIRRAWIAIALAIFTTIVMTTLLTGLLQTGLGLDPNDEAVSTIVGNLILWPAIAGLVLALMSRDRRLRNSALIWTAVIWNSVLTGIFLLLMIIGLAAGA